MQFVVECRQGLPIKRIYDLVKPQRSFRNFEKDFKSINKKHRAGKFFMYFFNSGSIDFYDFLSTGWDLKELPDPLEGRT